MSAVISLEREEKHLAERDDYTTRGGGVGVDDSTFGGIAELRASPTA
jgi:hypothetical protein